MSLLSLQDSINFLEKNNYELIEKYTSNFSQVSWKS